MNMPTSTHHLPASDSFLVPGLRGILLRTATIVPDVHLRTPTGPEGFQL